MEKTFKGKVRALRGVDMQVHRGEIFGLLGPNGAGKSTLVKILMTIVRPSEGAGRMLGEPVGSNAALERVGYLPEHLRFPDYLTGEQAMDFYGAMSNLPRRTRRRRTAELLELVDMKGWERKKIKGYSKGMKQRMGVAQALVHDPDLVFLDEPTDGVDPVGRRDIRNILVRLRDEGKTVFLNSHLLSELEMVCDRVAILVQGLVAEQGTLSDLTSGQAFIEIELDCSASEIAADLPCSLDTLPDDSTEHVTTSGGAQRVTHRGAMEGGQTIVAARHFLRVETQDAAVIQPLIDAARSRGRIIRAVRPTRPTLEDLFIRAVTDPKTGETLKPGAAPKSAAHAAPPVAPGSGGAS